MLTSGLICKEICLLPEHENKECFAQSTKFYCKITSVVDASFLQSRGVHPSCSPFHRLPRPHGTTNPRSGFYF